MYKISTFLGFFSLLFLTNLGAQSAKEVRPSDTKVDPSKTTLKNREHAPAVPIKADPFNIGNPKYTPIQQLNLPTSAQNRLVLVDETTGLPYFIQQKTDVSEIRNNIAESDQAQTYLKSIGLEGIQNTAAEFKQVQSKIDEQNNYHVRFQQMWKGLEVYGSEVLVHSHQGAFDQVNGRYVKSPSDIISVVPVLDKGAAIQKVRTFMNDIRVWTEEELATVKGNTHTTELLIYIKDNTPYLAYHITARPNPMNRHEVFMDANTGEVLNSYDNTCKIDGGRHVHKHGHTADCANENKENGHEFAPNSAGPVIGSGLDLLNINRTFGAYESGGTVYMEDTRKSMFNASASQMPNEPVGAIVTLDALNNSPQKPNFNYTVVTSGSNTFTNKKAAVSAHYNSNLCFDYFKNVHNRNSIDGSGGNIIAFVNVAEDDGSSMENAFWNGEAMWYGNGGSFFKPLAAGLDVGGHEMTHGVVEKTANLVYQNESGALNESFADIFGVMIDRDDWKIGEDVMQNGVSPNGALRSMEDPHNGASNSNSQWWQPRHYNERYTGTQDNGGVHINSGITNFAFYKFATTSGVGKDKAEKVYYKALDAYLVKSSRFVDCRAAVVQAAVDLYGNTVAQAAADAFTAVGIQGANPPTGGGNPNPNPGGDYLNNLNTNPGTPFILVTTEDMQNLQLADGSGNILGTIYDQGVASRPSVTDSGSEVVFVNSSNQIIDIFLEYVGGDINITTEIISTDPVWRNVAISKDGRFIAALTNDNNNKINFFDFGFNPVQSKVFDLYNPTYTNGQITDNVNFADVLEFDYSGEYLMYDAENALTSNTGQDLSYWDISFLQFHENGQWTDGVDDISKLFNGLPEGLSVGNPVFAKNSPYIIAFDLIDSNNDQYNIFGANIETGDNGAIVQDNGDLGYPNFDVADQSIAYESPFSIFGKNIKRQALASNKISPSGSASTLVDSRVWGVWFANGSRSLQVSADDVFAVENWLALSPNPTYNESFLDINMTENTDAVLTVFDVAGKVLQSKSVSLSAGPNRLPVDMASQKAGTYFVSLQTIDRKAVLQLIKM